MPVPLSSTAAVSTRLHSDERFNTCSWPKSGLMVVTPPPWTRQSRLLDIGRGRNLMGSRSGHRNNSNLFFFHNFLCKLTTGRFTRLGRCFLDWATAVVGEAERELTCVTFTCHAFYLPEVGALRLHLSLTKILEKSSLF